MEAHLHGTAQGFVRLKRFQGITAENLYDELQNSTIYKAIPLSSGTVCTGPGLIFCGPPPTTSISDSRVYTYGHVQLFLKYRNLNVWPHLGPCFVTVSYIWREVGYGTPLTPFPYKFLWERYRVYTRGSRVTAPASVPCTCPDPVPAHVETSALLRSL